MPSMCFVTYSCRKRALVTAALVFRLLVGIRQCVRLGGITHGSDHMSEIEEDRIQRERFLCSGYTVRHTAGSSGDE